MEQLHYSAHFVYGEELLKFSPWFTVDTKLELVHKLK